MKINEDFNKIQQQRSNNSKNNNNNRNSNINHQQQHQWYQNQRYGNNRPPQENNRRYLKEMIDTSSPVITPIIDNNALQDIVKLKEQMRQVELHIKDLEDQLLGQRKEIENFKQFIKETSAHNEYMSNSMDKMYQLQQNMAHNKLIKDSKMTEILMELKGINRNNNQNVHTQEENFQLKEVNIQHLN
ncbi:unnamed protein product [Rhizophagus irregularis]|nr:unnamed protein product [Rhizophagus irregularis]